MGTALTLVALRMAKTIWNIDSSECNRVKTSYFDLEIFTSLLIAGYSRGKDLQLSGKTDFSLSRFKALTSREANRKSRKLFPFVLLWGDSFR